MTVLIQEMSKTVVAAVNRGTFTLADWTVMPKRGVVKEFLDRHPSLRNWLAQISEERLRKKRLEGGFEVCDPDNTIEIMAATSTPDLDAKEQRRPEQGKPPSEHELARDLALAIQSVAHDLHAKPPRRYSYDQWLHFTQLIQFTRKTPDEILFISENDEGHLVEWDWIGENSPMLADVTEAQWVLERLCESLNRYTRRQAAKVRTCA
jgi:potassium channel subfamily K, other eukaryote